MVTQHNSPPDTLIYVLFTESPCTSSHTETRVAIHQVYTGGAISTGWAKRDKRRWAEG